MNTQVDSVTGEIEEEGREITTGALVAVNTAEINQQIMTAKAYPRDLTTFRKKVFSAATIDEAVAQSCMYALTRKSADGDKIIEGPSARFAEIVAQTWGNCRAGARVVEVGETHVTAQGFFYDLETNVAVSFEVMRPIVGKKTREFPNGKRFSNDMISVTGNAACSIALRNAVFKGVPKAFWNHGYLGARAVIAGDESTIVQRRTKLLKSFGDEFKVKPEQIYALIGVKGAPDITLDHMVFLGGLQTALRDHETTVERAFDPANFSSNGTMSPAAPEKSAFTREDDKPEGGKAEATAETRQETGPASEAAEDAKTGGTTEVSREDALAQERADFLDDMKKAATEKASKDGIGALTNFRDEVLRDLLPGDQPGWIKFIEDLTRETLKTKRTTTGNGSKAR